MKFLPSELPGVIVIEPTVHRDERGFFLESYNADHYQRGGITTSFVQDNHSRSKRGTLRGLHLQLEQPQDKLVRVISGVVYDVAVDVRRNSPHFGRYFALELSADNMLQLFIPKNFAHGFLVTSDAAEFEYKCSDFYHPTSELSIAWNDPEIGIPWPCDAPTLSNKDADSPLLRDLADRLPLYET